MKVTEKPDGTVEVDTGHGSGAAKATWDGQTIGGVLVKAEDERRYTLTLTYPADKADVGKAVDGHRDFAAKAAVEDAAWAFMRTSRQVVPAHFTDTSAGDTVESYIYRGPDWVVKAADGSQVTIVEGDWLMGIIWSEQAWPLVKSGQIRGVSPEGKALRRRPSREAVAALRS